MSFPSTRVDALARLEAFVPLAGCAYSANRNHDRGPDGAATTSRLSPAIRRRLISEAEVAARVVGAHGHLAAEKFLQEICWRTYWVGWLEQRPAIWRRYLADVERLTQALGDDAALRARYARAVAGRSGIDCFDAWTDELSSTGWLHNHARMNFASIWIFTLRLPWQLGADLFYRQLLDACPASNTLSWRWVAGLQTAGKSYLARAETIRAMSNGRFSVDARLATSAAPLPADDIPAAQPIRVLAKADPALPTGLFVTTADLSMPEALWMPEAPSMPAICAVAATSAIGGEPSDLKRAHAEAALGDGLSRAAIHFGCAPERLCDGDAVQAICAWAETHKLRQIVTADAAVGAVADWLDAMAPALAAHGVRLVRLRRDWDALAWPLASRGFFAFKPAIPKLLALQS